MPQQKLKPGFTTLFLMLESLLKRQILKHNCMVVKHMHFGIKNGVVLNTLLLGQLQSQLLNFKLHLLMGFYMIYCAE